MAYVKFTKSLDQFFPDLGDITVDAGTVAELVGAVDRRFPGLADYIVDERGRLRQHVNIFVGEEMIHDREALSDAITPEARVFIFQALSGG